LTLYASEVFRDDYSNHRAIVFAVILTLVFFVTGTFFFIFVIYVQKRQDSISASAIRSNAIVSSLFPSNVRARIMADADVQIAKENNDGDNLLKNKGEERESILENKGPEDVGNVFGSKPIADLFPETTLMVCVLDLFIFKKRRLLAKQTHNLSLLSLQFSDLVGFSKSFLRRESSSYWPAELTLLISVL